MLCQPWSVIHDREKENKERKMSGICKPVQHHSVHPFSFQLHRPLKLDLKLLPYRSRDAQHALSRDRTFGAPAIGAGRSTRGDYTCADPACGVPDDVYRGASAGELGEKVNVGVARAARLLVLGRGICAGVFPARVTCAHERLRDPGTARGAMLVCCGVVAGYSAIASSVRARKRSVLRLMVVKSVKARFYGGGACSAAQRWRDAQNRCAAGLCGGSNVWREKDYGD
ncbi:hypothetical protein B0H14DRAFT_3040691 [Mycena olivaceomarginata]|nr:hypothetical protein B0H14DRAFT_3040691 [Mycena olivaceomarginata]